MISDMFHICSNLIELNGFTKDKTQEMYLDFSVRTFKVKVNKRTEMVTFTGHRMDGSPFTYIGFVYPDFNPERIIEQGKRDIVVANLLKRGLTQCQVADLFDISQSLVSQIHINFSKRV